jgi:hypothetical protein
MSMCVNDMEKVQAINSMMNTYLCLIMLEYMDLMHYGAS